MADVDKKAETKSAVVTYSKKQIIKSKKYENNRDLVNALLKDDKNYSLVEVDKMIDSFMKGAVK